MSSQKPAKDAKDTIKTNVLIKIEEVCMLYQDVPKDGLNIIQDIVESALEKSR